MNEDEYTPKERSNDLELIKSLHSEVLSFYNGLFNLNTGGRFHAFVEWCGIMSEHLNIMEDLIQKGEPAFHMNRHVGKAPPIPGYRLTYLSEKVECIFGGLITVQATNENKNSDMKQTSFNASDDMKAIPKFTQTQRPLDEQLNDLAAVANRLGMYDAADHLRVNRKPKTQERRIARA